MVGLLAYVVVAAMQDTSGTVRVRDTSTYATPALRAMIAEASERNRRVPDGLRSYRARIGSEVAIVLRRPDGVEGAVSVEQFAGSARWDRTGAYEQHVDGYRAQQSAPTLSVLSFMRNAWTIPVLYGNRIALFFSIDSARTAKATEGGASQARREPARAPRPPMVAFHPLADDREGHYRYRGGDTVLTVRVGGRTIPIVRVHVEPTRPAAGSVIVFRGDLDLDVSRHQLVRMRGYFQQITARSEERGAGLIGRALSHAIVGIGYIELVNAEIEGAYWLPTYQRLEVQAAVGLAGDDRTIMRIVTRFGDYALNGDTVPALVALPAPGVAADTLNARPHRLTFAPRDSMNRPRSWPAPVGSTTAAVSSDDFDDLAPERWRSSGPPRAELRAERLLDILRYDRVEGLYTGAGGRLRLRDAAPGVEVRGSAGYAWAERTVRGYGTVLRDRGSWISSLRAGRTLDPTNDFLTPFDSTSALAAFFSNDDFDWVDRRFATLSLEGRVGGARKYAAIVETGPASDRPERTRVRRAPFPIAMDTTFRANRGVDAGSYWRSAATLVYRPDVAAELVRPGVGASLSYERADGGPRFARVSGRLVGRASWSELAGSARLDAGALVGRGRPPQRLFEVGGGSAGLPSYDYKQFAGDRAALARVAVWRSLPFLTAPLRFGPFVIPGPSPALAVGTTAGWVGASSDETRAALRRLAVCEPLAGDPCGTTLLRPSVPTDRVRADVEVGVRLFGGALFLGVARPVDRSGRWRGRVGV